MERGNHLFISEYGMQTSLRERFGIMSFAAEGRDFKFINKDEIIFFFVMNYLTIIWFTNISKPV